MRRGFVLGIWLVFGIIKGFWVVFDALGASHLDLEVIVSPLELRWVVALGGVFFADFVGF